MSEKYRKLFEISKILNEDKESWNQYKERLRFIQSYIQWKRLRIGDKFIYFMKLNQNLIINKL